MSARGLAVLAGAWLALAVPATVTGAEIVIGAGDLRPQTATAALGERVSFVNRSGADAHVEFHAMPRGHQVFHVPGEIWAVFHMPGRHGYTVHLSRPTMELHGVVDVSEAPPNKKETLGACRGITVEGACFEP